MYEAKYITAHSLQQLTHNYCNRKYHLTIANNNSKHHAHRDMQCKCLQHNIFLGNLVAHFITVTR